MIFFVIHAKLFCLSVADFRKTMNKMLDKWEVKKKLLNTKKGAV